ncbi:MAG: LmbE family protein [Bacteroidetes bacterium]|nr:LmbE family protein [Bacteroidota bacterium]
MLRTTLFLFVILLGGFSPAAAQTPEQYNSADLHAAIAKLQVLGSALYIAAHPDDENTSMISWLSNERKVRTAYLSLTRGDGGQNLIGPEIQELLGVIRTQELLAARRIDGGEQFFSRANDFGYSKHPDETLKLWNEQEVLADAVWNIRKFRPDVIINRFDHESAGRTHGHHTSSAIISYQAFDLAGDPNAFPEQLKYVDVWQPKRLFLNTSWWFYGSREAFAEADKSNWSVVDVGVFYPWIGKSNTEIAAASRSMHKCQGMGRTPRRGSDMEYLDFLKGEEPTNQDDPFSGIPTDWSRVKGGAPIGKLLAEIEANFDYFKPYKSVPQLLKARKLIEGVEDAYWRKQKLKEIDEVIYGCLGLFLEASAESQTSTPGGSVVLNIEAVNRSPLKVTLEKVRYQPMKRDSILQYELLPNENLEFIAAYTIPEGHEYTSPYWLNKTGELGMYRVDDQMLRGLPETPRDIAVDFFLNIEGTKVRFSKTVAYKRTDPVEGEVYNPFEVLPEAFVSIADPVYVFGSDSPKPVNVVVRAGKDGLKGEVKIQVPEGWRTAPASFPVELEKKGAEQHFSFELYPPKGASEGDLKAVITADGQSYDRALISIEYDHIPTQSVLMPATARAVKVDLKKEGNRIAYIMGAGDDIPGSLQQIGYQVDVLEADQLSLEKLKSYDALIMGIRVYNTVDRIEFKHPMFLEYVEQGGTMIVQYNTAHRLKVPGEEIGPYPLVLSRERVSVEEAEVRFLAPDHPVLNYPNKITLADFDGWIQERGLYFPNEWDEQYTPILSSNDPGEPARDGGLLVAPFGEGFYIYTGYSWFRELPAGVPGAYRLFTNLISLGQTEKP